MDARMHWALLATPRLRAIYILGESRLAKVVIYRPSGPNRAQARKSPKSPSALFCCCFVFLGLPYDSRALERGKMGNRRGAIQRDTHASEFPLVSLSQECRRPRRKNQPLPSPATFPNGKTRRKKNNLKPRKESSPSPQTPFPGGQDFKKQRSKFLNEGASILSLHLS